MALKQNNTNTTCFALSHNTLIDAGNIINSLGENASKVEHIFLTYAHSDHIIDLSFLLDSFLKLERLH